jgi:hypothetical protein
MFYNIVPCLKKTCLGKLSSLFYRRIGDEEKNGWCQRRHPEYDFSGDEGEDDEGSDVANDVIGGSAAAVLVLASMI